MLLLVLTAIASGVLVVGLLLNLVRVGLLLIQFLQLLFVSQVQLEFNKFVPHIPDHLHLLQQDVIQLLHVLFNITLRFVDLL